MHLAADHHRQIVLAQTAQTDLCPHPQRQGCGHDHRSRAASRAARENREELDCLGTSAVEVLDDDQARPVRRQGPSRGVEFQRSGIVQEPLGKIVADADISQQLRPHQKAGKAETRH
jgi:hypothetical protein